MKKLNSQAVKAYNKISKILKMLNGRRAYLELVVFGESQDLLHRSIFFEDDGEGLERDGIDHVFNGHVQNCLLTRGGATDAGTKAFAVGSLHDTSAAILTRLKRRL